MSTSPSRLIHWERAQTGLASNLHSDEQDRFLPIRWSLPCWPNTINTAWHCCRELEYEWVREYRFRFEHDPEDDALVSTCVLSLEADRVLYNRLSSRMALQKRPRGAITRPSRILVRKREPSEEEEAEMAAIRQRLDPARAFTEAPPQARASASPSLSE